MKNLYKIMMRHFSQKDSKTAMLCLVLAENDNDVYEWLKSEPKIGGRSGICHGWADRSEEGELRNVYDNDFNVIGQENWDEYMVRIGGEINDEDFENADAYYGNTLYGWELIKENCTTDYAELKELSIVIEL